MSSCHYLCRSLGSNHISVTTRYACKNTYKTVWHGLPLRLRSHVCTMAYTRARTLFACRGMMTYSRKCSDNEGMSAAGKKLNGAEEEVSSHSDLPLKQVCAHWVSHGTGVSFCATWMLRDNMVQHDKIKVRQLQHPQ